MPESPVETHSEDPAAPGQSGELPKGRPLLKALSVILFLGLITYTLYERSTVLQQMERIARDFHARLLPPRQATRLVVIRITDSDYETLFASTSPLDVDGLGSLLRAIAAGRPRLIAVDLATAEPQFHALASLEDEVPVIWARESASCGPLGSATPGCPDESETVLLDFAGSQRPDSRFGLVGMERDPDGVIRRYHRYFEVADTLRPSFATAVVKALREEPVEPTVEPFFIRYQPLPPGVFHQASLVMTAAQSPDFGENGVLRNRVVLLGGAYRAARDEHQTPLGEMFGVDVQAQVIQSELEGGGLQPVGRDVIGVLLFVNSMGLLFLFQLVGLRRAFWISVAGIPVLGTACSFLFAGSAFALWPYLIPLLIAVLIQQLYAHAIRYRDALIAQLGGKV